MPHRRPDRPGPALSPARASSGVVKRFDQQMIPTSPPAAPFVSPALLLRFPRESGGLGTAMAPLLQHGPQRRENSAGRMLGFTPFVSPAKAGDQEPLWCRCNSTDLRSEGILRAR